MTVKVYRFNKAAYTLSGTYISKLYLSILFLYTEFFLGSNHSSEVHQNFNDRMTLQEYQFIMQSLQMMLMHFHTSPNV